VLSALQYAHAHTHRYASGYTSPLSCMFYLFIYCNDLLNRRYFAVDLIVVSSLESCGYVVGLLYHLSVCFKSECQCSQHFFLMNLFLQKCKLLFYEQYG
jgi:hypothetical protein